MTLTTRSRVERREVEEAKVSGRFVTRGLRGCRIRYEAEPGSRVRLSIWSYRYSLPNGKRGGTRVDRTSGQDSVVQKGRNEREGQERMGVLPRWESRDGAKSKRGEMELAVTMEAIQYGRGSCI